MTSALLHFYSLPGLFGFLRQGHCSPGSSGTCSVAQTGLELRDPFASPECWD
ncbi:hypothetical protein I79_008183 [Cricetulus griseus]|uniref:Uncharacterized protein n=1 Tax=Cricetulus griseus TaxID=10029 RepID=G3HCH3_CRIGR|nr:hypothetical protein I79_008183 [Cricetulus griseus]